MADGVKFDQVLANGSPPWSTPLSLAVPVGTFLAIQTMSTLSSALFRLVLGVDAPSAGQVLVLDTQIHTLSRAKRRELRRSIGSVLIPDGLIANRSLLENLITPFVYSHGRTVVDAEQQSRAIIDTFQLGGVMDECPSAMSADVRQTAALARAVVGRPEILLLDGALASVDSVESARLLAICRQVVPTIIAATPESNPTLFDAADRVASWDSDGFRFAAAA